MSGVLRSKASRVAALFTLVIGGLTFCCWRAMQPKIRTASEAEIRALLPPELLKETPIDFAAQERFKRLVELANGFDRKIVGNLHTPMLPATERNEIAHRFWSANPHLLSNLNSVLDAGLVQSPIYKLGDMREMDDFSSLRLISKLMATSAKAYAASGEYPTAVKMLSSGVMLGDRLRRSCGTLIDYFVVVAVDEMTLQALVDIVSTSGFPVSASRSLLSHLPQSPNPDDDLVSAIRTDFQRFTLDRLPDVTRPIETIFSSNVQDPEVKKPIVGTYDALETARIVGRTLNVAILNARRPLSQFDRSERAVIENEGDGLPNEVNAERPDGYSKSWDELKYKLLMDNTRNSLGRRLLSTDVLSSPDIVEISDRWRAYRDTIRVLLASRIYRSAHAGRLPDTVEGFVPILGAWPTDPFNGKPMIYNREKGMAYSVGSNLVDDGGKIAKGWMSKDVGVSLGK